MLERQLTAERVNYFFNDSDSRSGHGGEGFLDFSSAVKNKDNYFLSGQHGCVCFIKHQPGIFEFHTSVMPEGRGEWMIKGSKYAFWWMFTHTDAYELMTQCPNGNLPAKAGARAVGCQHVFTTRPLWKSGDKLVPIDIYSIIIQHWAKTSEYIEDSGKWFHEQLEKKYAENNTPLTVHEEDGIHNRYVGATVEMLRHGQIQKAVIFYNRFAVMASYQPIKLLSLNPVTIDIHDCVLRISKNDFQIAI